MWDSNYNSWTIPSLKHELAYRGAATRGRKKDLVESNIESSLALCPDVLENLFQQDQQETLRLQAYDRNQNFQNDPITIPEPLSVDWPACGFKQVIATHKIVLPKITREQIEAYFLYRLAGDKQCTGDIKAIQKGELMFESNRVLACSIYLQDAIYFTGIVGAAMRQKVSYNFKLKLHKSTGDPLNSHCECPAGRGPHGTCKHLAAVMIMLEHFVSKGDLKIEKSCTDNLMTFHRPKAVYHGSPVKAEKLVTKRKLTTDFFADPRPTKYRNDNSFNDRVRNMITNYCSQTSKDISFRYLFPKADIQSAAVDHAYTSLKLTEHWIDIGIQVDEQKAAKIEKITRNQSGCPAWFKEREWRLTASRFGDICRATCRRNTQKLCQSLSKSHFTTHATVHGKNYEKKALMSFEGQHKITTTKSGLFVSVKYPFLGASPDAIVVGEDAVVEIKCPYAGRDEKIKPGPNFKFLMYDDKKTIVLKKTCKYYDQVQGQMLVTNRKFCYFVVYTFCDLFVQKVGYDDTYCTSCLIPKLSLFYEKYYRPYLASNL